jgi:hypothetical protein
VVGVVAAAEAAGVVVQCGGSVGGGGESDDVCLVHGTTRFRSAMYNKGDASWAQRDTGRMSTCDLLTHLDPELREERLALVRLPQQS